MKKLFYVLLGVVVLGTIGCLSLTASMKKSLAKIENEDIDMETVEDGSFEGHSELGPVKVDVKVLVENHKLDVIVGKMVEQNTWDVDAVSGATVSSGIIKNAVNKALR